MASRPRFGLIALVTVTGITGNTIITPSLPEILVDVTALRAGAPGIALGDALGSSLVDSTLSIGAGPAVVVTNLGVAHMELFGSRDSVVVALRCANTDAGAGSVRSSAGT
jgi:Ca2+/Na+ antiporter